jgi:nifR3 family TIM-barrel protein
MPVFDLQEITKQSVALAPMDDITDHSFRLICREFGSAFSFSEFVSADAIIRNVERTLNKTWFDERERPVIIQIFGSDPDVIVQAAKVVEKLNPDGIDINMGCSVKKIFQKGAGVGLMLEPAKVKEIFKKLVSELKTPVSAKIRLGWSEELKNHIEIGKILEGEGAWAVFIHGRTKSQGYTGQASWEEIGKLKASLKIPVFGNGDIKSLGEAKEKIATYNLNGVLIGRAAIGNPWIFSGIPHENVPVNDIKAVVKRHLNMNRQQYGDKYGVILFRKQLVKYLKGIPRSVKLKPQLVKSESAEEIIELIDRL